MKEITIEDLQRFGRFMKGVRCRPMTEKEIANFGVIPKGAIRYKSLESLRTACKTLSDKQVAYKAGSNPGKGLFWTCE